MSSSSNPAPHITLSILRRYYPYVVNLQVYLTRVLQPSSNPDYVQLLSAESSHTSLLNTAYVASSQPPNKYFSYFPPDLDMYEIIDQAQVRLFRSKITQNVLTLGYRHASHAGDRGRKGMARIGITNTFLNTMITALQAPEWEELLQRIGIDAMLHLLTETSVFLSLPNGCLCQVTGVPIIFITPNVQNDHTSIFLHPCEGNGTTSKKKRSFPAVDQEERPSKRPKLADYTTSRSALTLSNKTGYAQLIPRLPGNRSTPADIVVMRARVFYSRPDFIPHTKHILVGLPLKHVLNRLRPSFDVNASPDHTVVTHTRKEAEQVRHLSKYVFARQYGLATPFHSTTAKGAFKFAHYIDREAEIKALGSCKTPKRLKDTLPLLEKLLKRHQKCRYVPLRDKACSSKVKSAGNQDLDSSVILELMSEHSIQLRSQTSLGVANTSIDSSGNPIPPFGLTQAQKYARNKPRFIEFVCSHVEVYRYVVLVTNAVVPKSFWGTRSNLRLVLRSVKQFISCRRYESLSLHHILQGFSTSACDWLIPPGPGAQEQARVSVSDSLKRRELLEDFLFWYFDSFVLPLLKTTFYVTESSAFRNQVLYFRHDDWTTLCAPLIARLTSATFQKLTDAEAAEIFRQRKLGFSFVRLLPKETGVRPIVNLRRKKTMTRGSFTTEQSINQILQAAFNILTYERSNQPHLLGASVLGPDEIHKRLKAFKASLPRDNKGNLPTLYFVKVDVQTCFDTIDQTKLLQILRELISEDLYMTQKYGRVNMCLGKTKRTYVKKAVPQDDHPHFLRYATDLANILRNTIFVDQVIYPVSKKQEVLQLLEEHITENIVKIGQSYYRQTIGIPQGSVLSSILCSFFYGDLEKKFPSFTKDIHSVLLRLIDDYLFITTSLTRAKGFLDMMKKGKYFIGFDLCP